MYTWFQLLKTNKQTDFEREALIAIRTRMRRLKNNSNLLVFKELKALKKFFYFFFYFVNKLFISENNF